MGSQSFGSGPQRQHCHEADAEKDKAELGQLVFGVGEFSRSRAEADALQAFEELPDPLPPKRESD